MGVCVTFFGTKYVWKFADEKCTFEILGVREKSMERFLLFGSYFLEFLLIFKKFLLIFWDSYSLFGTLNCVSFELVIGCSIFCVFFFFQLF